MVTKEQPIERLPLAIKAAKVLAGRIKRADVTFRSAFVYRGAAHEPPPPATVLLRERSLDCVALKLELSLLWAGGGSAADPVTGAAHTLQFIAADFAALLGLDDPERNGKRRVRAALSRLESRRLIRLEARPGRASLVTVLREDGSGNDYEPPGAPRSDGPAEGKYHKVPNLLWRNGWMVVLSGRAVVALLALVHMDQTSQRRGSGLFISPSLREEHFAFSEDTFYAGLTELRSHLLVVREPAKVRTPFSTDGGRYRDTYLPRWNARLKDRPTVGH